MRTMLVYGDGQAEVLAAVLGRTARIAELMRIVYLSSSDYLAAAERIGDDDFGNCAVFSEQYNPYAFPGRDRLGKACFKLKFPALELRLLWPFHCINPYNVAEPPDFPFGRFPFGDRVIADAVDEGIAADDILDYYIGGWDRYRIDLDRFREFETQRMAEREVQCDVRMSSYILLQLAKQRLFWSVNDPAARLLEELADRTLSACGRIEPMLVDSDLAGAREAAGQMAVPIHPKVAEYFQLEWYDPNEKFRGWDGTMYSYTEYFSAMIRHSYAVKEQRP